MIQISDKIVSFDVLDSFFCCDLEDCKGICCVDGDAGAPLKEDEILHIEESYEKIKKYLKAESIKTIEKDGIAIIDSDGDLLTPCNEDGACVYLIKENGIYKCVFEIAYYNKEIDFVKPISCHLYPIRLKKYDSFTAVNYEKRNICKGGVECGTSNKIKLVDFLKFPIEREFGDEFFCDLKYASENYKIER